MAMGRAEATSAMKAVAGAESAGAESGAEAMGAEAMVRAKKASIGNKE